MDSSAHYLPYSDTGFFSTLLTDYVASNVQLSNFYEHQVNYKGISAAIKQREKFNTKRELLVQVLTKKYQHVGTSAKQLHNIQQLLQPNTFTITTAHQPNIFTGHLYFIYKILHAVKVADELNTTMPDKHFIPIYYMGSEDADLDELGHVFIDGTKYTWQTEQTGAVGRMLVDENLIGILKKISGQLLVHPFGQQIMDVMCHCYTIGITIEQATFLLVNQLFGQFGLLVLLPDNEDLKASFLPIIAKELTEQFSHKKVQETATIFPPAYKLQASGRPINLFYLQHQSRKRIEWNGQQFNVVDTNVVFSKQAMLAEFTNHPEKCSPNVILRPIFQEWVLPNIAFIGGGGEIGYWLELKKVFDAAEVPYPMLIVRNSFLIIEQQQQQLINKLQLSTLEMFKDTLTIINNFVQKSSTKQLQLTQELRQLTAVYQTIQATAGNIDSTLATHTAALLTIATNKINTLQSKMLRAERKKNEAVVRQITKLKKQLFPQNNLQERVENFMLLYAKHGPSFIQTVYKYSSALQQQFAIINLQ